MIDYIISQIQNTTLSGIIACLLTGILGDIFWTLYIAAVSENKRFKSATYSAFTGMVAVVSTTLFVNNWVYGLWWVVGLWVGTYYAKPLEKLILVKLKKQISYLLTVYLKRNA